MICQCSVADGLWSGALITNGASAERRRRMAHIVDATAALHSLRLRLRLLRLLDLPDADAVALN